MIDENKGYVAKSKLTITVKTLGKYNDRSRVAAKQTNRLRNTEVDKHLARKHTKGRKRHTSNRPTSTLTVDTRSERELNKKMKNKAPYVLLLSK